MVAAITLSALEPLRRTAYDLDQTSKLLKVLALLQI